MNKYYYENVLANENITAKTNVTWVADITEIELDQQKKLYVFLCVDVHSNIIIANTISRSIITSHAIIKTLSKAIEKRFGSQPILKVIIHTDRGSQFSSKAYNNFIKHYDAFVIPSMSRENTPTDNAVAERFIRTFKEHKIDNKTFQQELLHQIEINSRFRGYRRIFNLYVKDLGLKPNAKSKTRSPERYDMDAQVASMLMTEPKYSKAFSEFYGTDFRREHIDQYKAENMGVISILDEIAVKRAELVDKTPFDDYDSNLALRVIDDRLKSIYSLIMNNPELTRQYVEEAILPIQDMLESMDDKLNILLPKRKKERTILPLRDPVNTELFDIFIAAAGSTAKYKNDLKCAQLRIVYTILYYTGLRINEIRFFKEKDIQDAIKTTQFSVVHSKQRAPHIHVISDLAVEKLKKLKPYYEVIFVKYKYQYLFGKKEPVAEKHFIRTINNDLKHTCKINQIPYNIKSHSFRINMISKLLQNTSVQNAADIIGHRDIQSTMAYKRYALNKKEIKTLLNNIN
jgi:integrase